ncbi:hypothetical protein Gotri_027587 [Gossypium trilobum]|uniref:Uncharacterized protein n=1 Tax=Gossypium trilobum TaxID=34281 RepID=A0A7J9FLW1_9ROSI|nr:hypothetical protein [Gossypium trilobum]
METRGMARKASPSRNLLSALEGRVVILEESMGDVNEMIDKVDDRITDGLQSMKEQLREYVWDTIDSLENKLVGKDDALEAMVIASKEEINELKGELKIFKAAVGNEMLASKPKQQAMYVPKPKAFKWVRSTDVRRGGTDIGTWRKF